MKCTTKCSIDTSNMLLNIDVAPNVESTINSFPCQDVFHHNIFMIAVKPVHISRYCSQVVALYVILANMRKCAIYSKNVRNVRQCTSQPDHRIHLKVLQTWRMLLLVSLAIYHSSKSLTLYSEIDRQVH